MWSTPKICYFISILLFNFRFYFCKYYVNQLKYLIRAESLQFARKKYFTASSEIAHLMRDNFKISINAYVQLAIVDKM